MHFIKVSCVDQDRILLKHYSDKNCEISNTDYDDKEISRDSHSRIADFNCEGVGTGAASSSEGTKAAVKDDKETSVGSELTDKHDDTALTTGIVSGNEIERVHGPENGAEGRRDEEMTDGLNGNDSALNDNRDQGTEHVIENAHIEGGAGALTDLEQQQRPETNPIQHHGNNMRFNLIRQMLRGLVTRNNDNELRNNVHNGSNGSSFAHQPNVCVRQCMIKDIFCCSKRNSKCSAKCCVFLCGTRNRNTHTVRATPGNALLDSDEEP